MRMLPLDVSAARGAAVMREMAKARSGARIVRKCILRVLFWIY
jgi:hypothetical protein